MENSILTEKQVAFLKCIEASDGVKKEFYLTGGTALAGFYLHHRYSEDLDFFSENTVDPLTIDVFLKQCKNTLEFRKIDFQQNNNRNLFFLDFENEVLKTEFTYFPFPRIEKGIVIHEIAVDSILDIAVNKLFTVYQRTKARDYIDLYCICKEKKFSIDELIAKAKVKFDWHIDPLQLGTQFIKSQEAEDYPRMIKEIAPQEWRNFFLQEAKKLDTSVFS